MQYTVYQQSCMKQKGSLQIISADYQSADCGDANLVKSTKRAPCTVYPKIIAIQIL